jgi:ATP-dependent DNA helicase RecG
MAIEGQKQDKKSLRALNDVPELAKDVVAFTNADGGRLLIGIEDNDALPPAGQKVTDEQVGKLKKRLGELTINLSCATVRMTAENGGAYIEVSIQRTLNAPACTKDGQYYIRDGDSSRPMLPDELTRFMTDRPAFSWENQPSVVAAQDADLVKRKALFDCLRASDRVTKFVKDKTDNELMAHYCLTRDGKLTNLGVLCVGKREHRVQLNTAPLIQCIKYDERAQKIRKWLWDDYNLAPWEMVDAVWREVPDWQESYELSEGLLRKNVPVYDEVVVRELLVNALVHRPYTQRGDIFIDLYPDHLEIHNPGPLPIGVTPGNILHMTIKRNEHLAKIFHDLGLMEREGSGYDKIYEVLLTSGKLPPEVAEKSDRVKVSVSKKILDPHIIAFIAKADATFQLTQKERICLGVLAQHKSMTVIQLRQALKLEVEGNLSLWADRLVRFSLVNASGRTRGKTYTINPAALRAMDFKGKTTLGAIQPHRLRELILEDLRVYSESSISSIRERVGHDVPPHQLRRTLSSLLRDELIGKRGEKRHRKYFYLTNEPE